MAAVAAATATKPPVTPARNVRTKAFGGEVANDHKTDPRLPE